MEAMFHSKDGLYFERHMDGSVRVFKEGMSVTLEPAAWASVIASMSYKSETDVTFRQAYQFHVGKSFDIEEATHDK